MRTELETDFCRIIVSDKEENSEEFRIRHATHALIKEYRKRFGDDAALALMKELDAYHNQKVVGVR